MATQSAIPGHARPSVHVFIVSGDHPAKCYPALDRIAPDLGERTHVTVLSGLSHPELGELRDYGARVTFRHFPGDSVWHLRARLPPMAGSFEWILVLEDHNVPLPGWLAALQEVLGRTGEGVPIVFGATSNLTSTDAWSWANYLAVQVFHWAPEMRQPVQPLPFNAAIRSSLLPARCWELGEYETVVLARLMRDAQCSARFPVDHIQFRRFPEVLTHHWFNGRSTGAFIRTHSLSKIKALLAHVAYVLVVRPARTFAALRRHPLSGTLPAGTYLRTCILALAHGCGAVVGFLAGPGESMWRLE
ncbi:MAG: hypothetical protein NDJ19_11290 [Ramlibacter sp.]|nr:hypothetical protein [Ramlibacter sp.]